MLDELLACSKYESGPSEQPSLLIMAGTVHPGLLAAKVELVVAAVAEFVGAGIDVTVQPTGRTAESSALLIVRSAGQARRHR